MTTVERRHELVTEIRFRLNSTDEHRQLREAYQLEDQSNEALEELLRRLVRSRVEGDEACG